MKYQLVLKWPYSSTTDFDRLTQLEKPITEDLGDTDPGQCWPAQLMAGYRDLDENEYVAIYPVGLNEFVVR
jgi:hypothetical protein